MYRFSLFLTAITALLLSACSVNPVTGESELSLVSEKQEIDIGTKNYLPYQQQQGGSYQVDPALNRYVAKVGQQLAKYSHNTALPYEFVVLNNGTPNAWALPGGKIAINRGLLVLLEDEAQLAAVLGHEIVHAAARHSAAQMTRAQLTGALVGAVGLASRDTQYGSLAVMGANGVAGVWQAKYGRDDELESDNYGIDYMVKAGYDPYAAVELQETFVKLSKSGGSSNWLTSLLASHPPSEERVAKNKAKAATLPKGKRNRAAYQKAIAQINKDQQAYDKHVASMKAAGEKDYTGALGLLDEAIQLQPKEALFYATKGQILLAQDKNKLAKSAFDTASTKNPNYYIGHLGLGLVAYEEKNTKRAKSALDKSIQLLPTQIAVYRLGQIAVNENNKPEAIKYFTSAASGGGEIGKAAQQELNKLQPPASTVQ